MTFDPKMAAIAGVPFISNIDGSICEAGWYRNARIEEARWLVRRWRYRNPIKALSLYFHVHRIDVDPVLYRAQEEYMSLILTLPERSVRETWYMAWHNARWLNNPDA